MPQLIGMIIDKKDIVNNTIIFDFDKLTEENFIDISDEEFYDLNLKDPVALTHPIKKLIVMSDGKIQSINIFDYNKEDLEEEEF